MTVSSGHVHVAVYADTKFADIALPATVPIGELIPAIHDIVGGPEPADTDKPDATGSGGGDVSGWGLARVGAAVFSNDATLAVLGVDDGEVLQLRAPGVGPAPTPIIEDLADAAAIHAAHDSFGHHLRAPAAQYAAMTATLVIAALTGYGWHTGHRLTAAAVFAALTAGCAATVMVLRRRGHTPIADRVALIIPAAAGASAAAACPPVVPLTARLSLAAAAALAASLLVIATTGGFLAAHTTIAATAATTAALLALAAVWHVNPLVAGCVAITISLLLARNAATLAAVLARYPLPDVPAPGEKTPDPLPTETLVGLAAKTAICHSRHSGLVAATALITAAGAVLVCWPPAHPPLAAYWLGAAAVIVTAMRARILDSAACVCWLLATPVLTLTALAAVYTATGAWSAAITASAALAWIFREAV